MGVHNSVKVTGCVKHAVEEHWVQKTAKSYFLDKYIVLEESFD